MGCRKQRALFIAELFLLYLVAPNLAYCSESLEDWSLPIDAYDQLVDDAYQSYLEADQEFQDLERAAREALLAANRDLEDDEAAMDAEALDTAAEEAAEQAREAAMEYNSYSGYEAVDPDQYGIELPPAGVPPLPVPPNPANAEASAESDTIEETYVGVEADVAIDEFAYTEETSSLEEF